MNDIKEILVLSNIGSETTGGNIGKTVAIILGSTAGVAFVVICLLFARGLMKKHDDY
uniref:Uncharacterized protein n=1 Tax=Cucumis sativus TaxID=3659 RepID=A0A0A0L9N8_CUCSA